LSAGASRNALVANDAGSLKAEFAITYKAGVISTEVETDPYLGNQSKRMET
jgi:hypothetical protein